MVASFLYERITRGRPSVTGTLAEPQGAPEPRFALQGSVNWMHALALVVQDEALEWSHMQTYYQHVQRFTNLSDAAMNTVFEQLLMSLHHLSAVKAMANAGRDQDLVRVGIMAWYYGIYCAASAMIAARDGSQQKDHTSTATQWDRQIASDGLAVSPFAFRLTTLVKKDATSEIAVLRNGNNFSLPTRPTNVADARGACISYLSGTRDYREWQICEDLKLKELSKLGLNDFRSKRAQQLRDGRLQGRCLGFLHQAFRYRGKANYRDALFLTYEAQVDTVIKGFISDMETVLKAFIVMAGAFCSKRVDLTYWQAFLDDLEGHLGLTVMPKYVWT
ncbi:hypothetical protein PL263_12440 [Methylomonas sp. EFPC3]|uniref:hypothetical protein n=1 Tax=Methylomonas sp. EFPC3 TaxID=3021710 RepID=UPI002417A10C|nr:hypothetical protein [Methylomonas sp. EFPC3]WFP48914.1 hypothetical protein PL263_12440 [Methylomonas sp. EFPC3]